MEALDKFFISSKKDSTSCSIKDHKELDVDFKNELGDNVDVEKQLKNEGDDIENELDLFGDDIEMNRQINIDNDKRIEEENEKKKKLLVLLILWMKNKMKVNIKI